MAVVGPTGGAGPRSPPLPGGPSPPQPTPAHICPGEHSGGLQGADSVQPPSGLAPVIPTMGGKARRTSESPLPRGSSLVKNRGSGLHLRAPSSWAERRVTDSATQRQPHLCLVLGETWRSTPPPSAMLLRFGHAWSWRRRLRAEAVGCHGYPSLQPRLCAVHQGWGDPGGKNLSVDPSRWGLLRERSSLWPQQSWGF